MQHFLQKLNIQFPVSSKSNYTLLSVFKIDYLILIFQKIKQKQHWLKLTAYVDADIVFNFKKF